MYSEPSTAVKLPVQPQGPVRRLTSEEAVLMALEQNINLQVDRIDPQVSDLAISVVKKRGSRHERTIREFYLNGNGIEVGEPLSQFRGVLTGVPIFEGPSHT